MPAVNLRVKVLEAQNRRTRWRRSSIHRHATTSIEQAEDIGNAGAAEIVEQVRQHAARKASRLTTDPVARLHLRYQLIPSTRAADFTAAPEERRSALPRQSKILGVVRSTADFYWRMKMQPQVLPCFAAAKDAYPRLARNTL